MIKLDNINILKNMNINKESGQASRLLLILAIVVLIAGIIVYLVVKMATPVAKTPVVSLPAPISNTPSLVFQKQINDIQFIFQTATNKGNVLTTSEIINSAPVVQIEENQNGPIQNINATSGGKFIQVTVGAQNEGLANIDAGSWDIGNVVDSQGRNFVPLDPSVDAPWISASNSCGALLLPAFDPVPCTKIYEISNKSTGLKITIENLEKSTKNAAQIKTKVASTSLIDIKVQ